MAAMVQMGANVTAATFNWCDIEREQGTYDWAYADWMVQNTVRHNLSAVAYTGNTPDWALDPAVLRKYGPGIGYRFPPVSCSSCVRRHSALTAIDTRLPTIPPPPLNW